MTPTEVLAARSFALTDTGGGVVQWTKTLEGGYVLVTDSEGEQPTELGADVLVGTYDEGGNQLEVRRFATLAEFLRP